MLEFDYDEITEAEDVFSFSDVSTCLDIDTEALRLCDYIPDFADSVCIHYPENDTSFSLVTNEHTISSHTGGSELW